MRFPDHKKKLIYWGIGIQCWKCLVAHPEISPDGFLDRNYEESSWRGKPVWKPQEYEDWENSFVIVSIGDPEECFSYLNSIGLKEGTDFSGCEAFFDYRAWTNDEMIINARERIKTDPKLTKRTIIHGPLFSSRASDTLLSFFKAYAQQHSEERYLLLARLNVISEERAEELIGFPVLNIASADERDAKTSFEKNMQFFFDLLSPRGIMIWGGWISKSFFLQGLAKERNIPYAYFEHGFIPGTIQCDREGIAGYGEIGSHPSEFQNYPVPLKKEIFYMVRDHIVNSGADTGVFRVIRSDQDQLEKIRKNHNRIILLIGSDCIHWDVEGGSDFWKRAVSEEVNSSEEAFQMTLATVRKNGWSLIYKPHPGNSDDFCEQEINELDVAIVRYASIDDLLRMSDAVVTVSTAVSYKTLFYEKPLVEIGKSGFYGQGCSYEVHGDLEEKLKEALEKGVTEEQKKCFIHHVLTLLSYNHWDDLTHPDLPYGLTVRDRFLDDRRKNK